MSDVVGTLTGSCHCENIRFELTWPGSGIAARTCGCSFCRKHGGTWTSSRDASLSVTIGTFSLASKYAFGTRSADFYVCSRCGVVPLVTSTIEDHVYAVVNVNCLNDTAGRSVSSSAADFDGEGMADRLSRRAGNWIPSVEISILER